MPDRVKPSGRIHWLGAGLSTGSGLIRLADGAGGLTVWNRRVERAAALTERLGIAARADVATFSPGALRAALAPGDTVVCLLPVALHPQVLAIALDAGAHYVSTSYVSPEVAALSERMREKGLVCLVESGLDPGIDHILAHRLVAQAQEVLGDAPAEIEFSSYCGGVPAETTPFRYKFSWAPAGVLLALAAPATWISGGAVATTAYPWEATQPYTLNGEQFEAYPNRDSIPFAAQYGLPPQWRLQEFVRGTLRLEGWRAAWAEVFTMVKTGNRDAITTLAERLAAENSYRVGEADRVVMSVTLTASRAGEKLWQGGYELDLVGDAGESAMARCVSQTAAIAALDVLAGRIPPGLSRAVHESADVDRWLSALAESGIIPKVAAGLVTVAA